MSTACAPAPAPARIEFSQPFFPGIVTTRLVATCEFYQAIFDFRLVQAGEDTMLLARADGARLGLLRAGNLGQPAALQGATRGTGVWFTLEVDDPEACFTRAGAAGAEIVAEPECTATGTRRFIARDPSGVLVYVTERTPTLSPGVSVPLSSHHHDQDHRHSVHRLPGH